ncbi:hypothetical protein FQV26_09125 [Planococcus sp. CPCC 101016]|uniref:hypothetical protein n=1 Tax=Planococcus sp. CPCC 101016 TaxID=2599617 RepID=UPI0011B4B5F2|nr:hypothetical protein [Planococcus sp. CPCC 101016]TWT07954.1 hypothetical protein FQV26_09125 [Planococcus sp. CPCC 101016]
MISNQLETFFILIGFYLPYTLPFLSIAIIIILIVLALKIRRIKQQLEECLEVNRQNNIFQQEQTKNMDELNQRLSGIELMLKKIE